MHTLKAGEQRAANSTAAACFLRPIPTLLSVCHHLDSTDESTRHLKIKNRKFVSRNDVMVVEMIPFFIAVNFQLFGQNTPSMP